VKKRAGHRFRSDKNKTNKDRVEMAGGVGLWWQKQGLRHPDGKRPQGWTRRKQLGKHHPPTYQPAARP